MKYTQNSPFWHFLHFLGRAHRPHSRWGWGYPLTLQWYSPYKLVTASPPPMTVLDTPLDSVTITVALRFISGVHLSQTSSSCDKTGPEESRTCQEGMWLLCCAVVGDVRHYVTSLWTRSRHFHSQHTFTFRFFFFTATAIWISGRSLRTELRAAVSFPLCNRYSIDICGRTVNGRRPRAITLWSTLISSLPPVDRLTVVV